MVLPTCSICGSPRASRDAPCPRCSGGRSEDETLPVLDVQSALELEDDLAPRGGDDLRGDDFDDVRDDVRVEIRTRIEYPSIPRTLDPIANVLVDITPHGPPVVRPGAGPVAHVILLLDLSASMNHPDKYPVLTEALSGMLQELASPQSADVLLSVVLFAWGSEILLRDVPAKSLVPRQVLSSIDASPLRFGRYTDAAGALRLAGRIAADQLRANRGMPTRIYLLTDGKPQDVPLTTENFGRLRAFSVDVDSLAFGADADVGLLQGLVSGGRGGTVKLVRSDTLGDAFGRIAEVAQRVVCNRAVVEFAPTRGVMARAAYRYRPGRHKFDDPALLGNAAFRADLGALESGRTYSLLFELRIPESEADVTDVGRIGLRIRRADSVRDFAATVVVPRTDGTSLPEPDGDVAAARDVLAALTGDDVETQLRALRLRRDAYVLERRDPRIVAILEKAIRSLESEGSLAALTVQECAAIQSHTCTAGGARPPAARSRQYSAG